MSGWDVLLTAAGLVLIAEGLMPFINPAGWRRVFERMLQLPDAQLRVAGLASIALGLLLVLLV